MRLTPAAHAPRSDARLRRLAIWLGTLVVLGSTGGACAVPRSSPETLASAISIDIEAVPVPLTPQNPTRDGIGDFRYAGGLILTSRQTDRLHGLSDLVVSDTDRLTVVGDLGVFLDARLVFDDAARLVGLADASLQSLTGEDGRPLSDKEDADAEGLALLSSGDRLVSFERRHRILRYPAAGGSPRPVPAPDSAFPPNGGMEALAADPDAAGDAYVVGAEKTGDTWTCRLSAPTCVKGPSIEMPAEFGLVAIARLPGMRTAYLLRAYDATRGNRISLQIFQSTTRVATMDMARPLTVDNFEGLAAVPRADGSIRFFLLSDDNDDATQRTLLLAFDWRP